MQKPDHILSRLDAGATAEQVRLLWETAGFRLERIASPAGHSSAGGQWYDQPRDEWVLVVQGRAGLAFEGGERLVVLNPGDHLFIPAHRRHRLAWTDPLGTTVWLALHADPDTRSA